MLKINNYHTPLNLVDVPATKVAGGITPGTARGVQKSANAEVHDFATELSQATNVQFSKHARQRMESRGIAITPEVMTELSSAMDKAAEKGARETLVLMKDSAYVVSAKNRTVISAFDRDNLREGVFTSIDSAVIVK